MTAREAWGMGIDDIKLQLVSPEATPLALFGPEATEDMAELLDQARVTFTGSAYVRDPGGRRLEVLPDAAPLDSQRVVALPTIEGIRIDGVPADDHGFVPLHRRLRGPGRTGAPGQAGAPPRQPARATPQRVGAARRRARRARAVPARPARPRPRR